jgi:hypothetical protein
MKKRKIDSKLYQLTLEKMVIGLEEPILIKGVGEIIAKVDSGNGGYNVIHGEDLTVQGDILTFKTHNKDGEDRRISKKIKDTLNVNIGGGHIQERPVIELDVQFGGQEYKKVLFSVTDRSGNDNKVLISKDFVGKELDALIDVTKNKIADDGIEVEYVSEGFMDALAEKGVNAGRTIKNTPGNIIRRAKEMTGGATDAKSTASKAKIGPNGKQMYKVKTKGVQQKGNWVDRFYDASQRFKKWVNGQGTLFNDLEQFVEGPALLEKFLKSDADIIKKEVTKQAKLFDKLQVNVSDVHIYKILDFLGGTCIAGKYAEPTEADNKRRLLKQLKAAQKTLENSTEEKSNTQTGATDNKNQQPASGEENEETIIKEADENINATSQTTSADGNNSGQQAKVDELTKQAEGWKTKLQEIKTKEEGRNFFIIYYVAFGSTVNGEKLSLGKEALEPISNFVLQNGKSIMANRVNVNVVENFATTVKDTLSDANTRGVFVFCEGSQIPRPITIAKNVLIGENFNEVADNKKKNKQQAVKKAAENFISDLEKNLELISDTNIPDERLKLDIEKLKNYNIQDVWKLISINLASKIFDDFINIIKANQDTDIFNAFLHELGINSADGLPDKWSNEFNLDEIKNALNTKLTYIANQKRF